MVWPFAPCTVTTSPSAFGEYSPIFSGRRRHFAFTQATNGSGGEPRRTRSDRNGLYEFIGCGDAGAKGQRGGGQHHAHGDT